MRRYSNKRRTPLLNCLEGGRLEAGCDEAGRGCLAGPVTAAAVILPEDFDHPLLNDSKQMTASQRDILRIEIEQKAIAWAVCSVDHEQIDQINILNASILAMHGAIGKLKIKPDFLLVDGNRFKPYPGIEQECFIKGDARYRSIAAASVLAKTWRDEQMCKLESQYPNYHWSQNKGYPTKAHRKAIALYGPSPVHRMSFRLLPSPEQTALF